jgi:hypothetical protein
MASKATGEAQDEERRKKRATPKSSKRQPKKAAKATSGLGRLDDSLLFVLRHPLRVRMLVSLNEEGDGSSSDLGERLNAMTERVAYHMGVLLKHKFVKLVRVEQVGSATKKIYRALRKVEFPKEVWEQLPSYVQNQVLTGLFMTSFADIEAALLNGAYEKRPESHASWTHLSLDDRAWRKLIKLFDGTFEKAMKIGLEAKGRLEAEGIDPLNVSVTMSAFVLPEGEGAKTSKTYMRHGPEGADQRRPVPQKKKHS